jgi:hypothetical protein
VFAGNRARGSGAGVEVDARQHDARRGDAPGLMRPEQERRGTDPLMAGINTRRGALAPRAFGSLIHHDKTRS